MAILVVFGVLTVGVALVGLAPGKTYPACGDSIALAELGKLFDNQHLLHAVAVSSPHLLSDGFKGRYCLATIKWANSAQTDVHYEFYWAGGGKGPPTYLSMYIDYNGGFRGPSYH